MIADFRKGEQMYDKELQSFNLRSSVLIRVSSDKYYSVELCVTLWWVLLISDQFRLPLIYCKTFQENSVFVNEILILRNFNTNVQKTKWNNNKGS